MCVLEKPQGGAIGDGYMYVGEKKKQHKNNIMKRERIRFVY
jgi:hypothetical protein